MIEPNSEQPAKMKKIQSKKKALSRVVTTLFINFKMLKGSLLHNRSWDLDEIHTHSSFYSCPSYLQDLKLKALEWSQLISHYEYMGIFPDAQGQVTPQFKV